MPDMEHTDNNGPTTPPPDRLTSRSQWSNWTVLALLVLCFFAIYYLVPKFKGKPAVEGLARLQLQPLIGVDQPVEFGDLTGRVVLLNFWGTWCPPCLREFPHMAALQEKLRDEKGFRMLLVSCGPPGRPEDMDTLREATQAFLQRTEQDVPIYADPGAITRKAVDETVGFKGYPTTVILGRRGTVRGTWSGFAPGVEVEMETLIEKLLAEG